MSQSGNVLHLYVEVRSAPDQSGKGKGESEGLNPAGHLVQDNPAEILSKLTSQTKGSQGHRLVQDCMQYQSPSKHSVSFQLQQTNPQSPLVKKHWSSPCHKLNSSPGKVTTHYGPPNCLKKQDDGKRSVVSFSYVEKSNVKTIDSPERFSHFRKRVSDPVWFGSPNSSCSSSPFKSPGHQQYLSRQVPILDPIGRAATQRAVEEFGSPLLRIKLAHALESRESYRDYRKSRCQSWAGSPLQCQNICRNSPQKMHSNVEKQSPSHKVTSSPATERHFDKGTSLLDNNKVEGMNQLSESKSVSPSRSPEIGPRLAEEVSKVSCEMKRTLTHNALGDLHNPASSAQHCKMNIPLNEQLTLASDFHQPENANCYNKNCHKKYQHSSSPQSSPAIPSRLVRPTHPPTETSSPVRDPRLTLGELRAPDTPTLHRYQPPQYTGDVWTPSLELRGDFEKGDCTELARRMFINENVEEAPVSWTSRQQWGNHVVNSPRPSPESEFVSNNEIPTPPPPTSQTSQKQKPLSPRTRQKRAEQRRREILLLGPVALDSPDEDEEGCDEEGEEAFTTEKQQKNSKDGESPGGNGGSSSRSSSGITGSLGDRECVSPESSQSSHHSNETGAPTSGIQTDSGSVAPVPSLHCQKIARAKWEFLFGTPAEEAAGRRQKNGLETSTAPPSGNSSESPTPTPPSSLPLLSANHEVQHVEVELVTPPPAVVGTSPKTGIIRRTLKYSETDLDAVPLRCYRETDIDEVLLAEQDDADSAFGSNRSVQVNSGTGSSPLGGAYNRIGGNRGDKKEDEDEDDEDDSEEEEEMVSWASVRMQGDDRKRQHASRDDPEVFEPMPNRPEETFFDNHHPALKSPILVSGPRLSAEDTFSRHFESIMESHRAKGTSYNSLDSEEILTSTTQTVLTFDLPTLTPAIHGPVCQSARQIVQLSFAPLAHDERPSLSDSIFTVAGDSDATRAPSSERLSSGSDDTPPRRREVGHISSGWYSNPSFSLTKKVLQSYYKA